MFFQNNFIRTILMYGYQNLSALKKVEYEKKIFINSIPKSGTHLITNLLDADKRMLNSGYHLKKYTVNLLSNNEFENLKFKLDKEKFSRILEKNKKGRLISTHLPWDSNFDNSFLGINTIYKKIFFVRDPRDIFLSEFYYIKNLKRHFQHDAFMSLTNDEERFKILLYGGRIKDIPFKSYSEKLDEYCGWLNCKDIKVLKYENFASQCVEEDRLYDNLKDLFIYLELKLDEEISEDIIKTNGSKKSYTFRKGGSGGWKEKLSSEQKLRMNEQLEKACRVLDYDTEI